MQPNEMVDESQQHADDIDSAGSACGDNPKSSKPMMEKRRRARINNSLNELKTILLDALKKDTTRHSKLEKADILEMTVKYLRRLERQRVTAIKMNPAVVNKYKAGFNECRNEVMKFLSTHEGVAVGVRTQLLGHLENCQQSLQDQDQDFSCDEFADPPMDWKTSAMQIDSQTSPRTKSPSTSSYPTLQNEDQNQTDAMKELGAQDYPTVSTGLVEGQLQILSSATPSPPSSVEISSPNRAPFKDVAFVVPRVGPESGFVANIPNSSSSYGHPVVFQTLPANTVPHETVAYRNPEKVSYRSIEAVDITQPVFTTTGHSPFVPVTTPSGNMGFTVGYLIPFTGNGDTNTHEIQAPSLTQEGHGSLVCHTREDRCIGSYNSSPGHYQREHMIMNSGQAQYSQQLDRRDSNASNPWRPWSHDKS